MSQAAANHELSGVRVPSKIVPAITEVLRPQFAHIHQCPPPARQLRDEPHSGQTNPSGQRSRSRNAVQASSSENADNCIGHVKTDCGIVEMDRPTARVHYGWSRQRQTVMRAC